MDNARDKQMTEEQRELFTLMSSALAISIDEMATVLQIDAETLTAEIMDDSSEWHRIYQGEYAKRKTKVLNAILNAAERDAPEAQKMAIKIMERRDLEWQRISL